MSWYRNENNQLTYPHPDPHTPRPPHHSQPLHPQRSSPSTYTYTSGPNPSTFVQIHVLAYIFTRSVQTPVPGGPLAATLLLVKPCCSKTLTYHGLNPALLNNTLPPILSERLTARTCSGASGPPGVNQSMLSMRTAMVRLPGCMRAKTSESSSVWMRRLSRAVGAERRAWDLGAR